jgi:hypothetical protein
MLDTEKGGLLRGGVGTCRMGRGGALEERGSVTPGIEGISGGRLRAEVCVAKRPTRVLRETKEGIAAKLKDAQVDSGAVASPVGNVSKLMM